MKILTDFSTNDKLQKALISTNRRGKMAFLNLDHFKCVQDEYSDHTKQEPYGKTHFIRCPSTMRGNGESSDDDDDEDEVEAARNYIGTSVRTKLSEAIEEAMESMGSASTLKNMDAYYEKLSGVYKQLNKQITLSSTHLGDIELLVTNTLEDITNIKQGDPTTINFSSSKQCANLFMYTYMANSYQLLNLMHKKLADIRKVTASIIEQRKILATVSNIRISVTNLFKQYIGDFPYPLLTTIPAATQSLTAFYNVTCKNFGNGRLAAIMEDYVKNYSAAFIMCGLSIVPLDLVVLSQTSAVSQHHGFFKNTRHHRDFVAAHSDTLSKYASYISEYFYARTQPGTNDAQLTWRLTGLDPQSETVKKETDKRIPGPEFYAALDIDGTKIHATFKNATTYNATEQVPSLIEAFSVLSPRGGGRQTTNLVNRQVMICAVEPLIVLGQLGNADPSPEILAYIDSIPARSKLFSSLGLRLIIFTIVAGAEFVTHVDQELRMRSRAVLGVHAQAAKEILASKSISRSGAGIVYFNEDGTELIINYKRATQEAIKKRNADTTQSKIDIASLLSHLEEKQDMGLPPLSSYIKQDTIDSAPLHSGVVFDEKHKKGLPLSMLSAISFDQALSGGSSLTIDVDGAIHFFYFSGIDKIVISLV